MSKLNILIIHADQHRCDCLGAYGNKEIKTPNIDALADDGVIFDNSFCPHPVCTPSRYSLLTGLYIHQHRGLTNVSSIPQNISTLPRELKQNGYRTSAVGKMHFTPTYLDVGFDNMMLSEQCGRGRYDDDYHRWLKDEGLVDRIDLIDQETEFRENAPDEYWDTYGAMTSDLDDEHYSTTWIGEKAREEIDQWQEEGNLMMIGFIKPHHPFDPPAPWDKMYNPEELTLLPGWTEALMHADDGEGYFSFSVLTEPQLRRVMAMYYATISQIDFQVGKIIEQLKAKGLYDNTIIIYTSDHGDYMGQHHRILKGYRMLDSLMRIPLIIKFCDQQRAGERDERLVNNIDVAPTILKEAGLPVPDSMLGIDLADQTASAEYVFAESGPEFMIRTQNRKLLLNEDDSKSMFFDLEKDPLELTNLYGEPEYQEEIQKLKDILQQWQTFDGRPTNFLDMDAMQCQADNVPAEPNLLYPFVKQMMEGGDLG